MLNDTVRTDWVRLRTLIYLRWMAVVGQTATVVIASQVLGIDLRLDLCALVVATSAAFNIVSTAIHPQNKRLSERDTALTLLFDLAQLAVLLYLCGGLTNPFSVLVLAPVTISATALNLRATLLVGFAAAAMITLIAIVYTPLRFLDGRVLELPPIYVAGTWVSLMIGIVFVGAYAHRVTVESYSMSQALVATQLALAREQRLTALGGLVAAAAHELGTPLATIKLVSSEMSRDMTPGTEAADDMKLIEEQTDRCRDILRSMGQMGKDDSLTRVTPISGLIAEAAEPHLDRGRDIVMRLDGSVEETDRPDQPEVRRHPEIIHGLRNLIQNAVDFSHRRVWIDVDWDDENVRISVGDDGRGYSPDVLGRLGDPFIRRREELRRQRSERPVYEGMGLGLFIAKTLLERSGGKITFANGSEDPPRTEPAPERDLARPTGAIVEVVWPLSALSSTPRATREALGENMPFTLRDI